MKMHTLLMLTVISLFGAGFAQAELRDNGDGTVIDTAQGVVWLKNANCFGSQKFSDATNSAMGLMHGICGLSDKSKAGDWRLPTREQLEARGRDLTGFGSVQINGYWSSTPVYNSNNSAWYVNIRTGYSYYAPKSAVHSVLPVRSVQ